MHIGLFLVVLFFQRHSVKRSFCRELLSEEMKVTCASTGEKSPRCRACADRFLMVSTFSPDSFNPGRKSLVS